MNLPKLRNIFNAVAIGAISTISLSTHYSEVPEAFKHDIDLGKTEILTNESPFGKKDLWLPRMQSAAFRQWRMMRDSSHATYHVEWMKNFDDVKDKDLFTKIDAVQRRVNAHVTYTADSIMYQGEYWACALETLQKQKGDCEDFAIAKFYTLKNMDIPDSRYCLMLVATRKEIISIPHKVNHAVLAVDTSAANNWEGFVVLDNSRSYGPTIHTETKGEYRFYVTPQNFGSVRTSAVKTASLKTGR